jgi:uncharacterized protein
MVMLYRAILTGAVLAAAIFSTGCRPGQDLTGILRDVTRNLPTTLPGGRGGSARPLRLSGTLGTVGYAGYAEEFQPIKGDLLAGRINGVRDRISFRYGDPTDREAYVDRAGLLGLLEAGSLRLLWGDTQGTIADLRSVEEILSARADQSVVEEGSADAGLFLLQGVLGDEEIGGYAGEGYEKILMLNFASMAYLLEGDEKAYNVTRRAIDWQNVAWKAFKAEREELRRELHEARKEGGSSIDQKSLNELDALLDGYETKSGKQVVKVEDAYLNPFGYYLAGVVQELKSSTEPSLIENALISYRKALELAPGSEVLKRSVTEAEKSLGRRTVHVVVGEGLAPERKVMTMTVTGAGDVVPVKIPVSEPVPSQVSKIEVQDGKGKRLGVCSTVSDIEGIVMRHHRDLRDERSARVVIAVVRSFVKNELWRRLAGMVTRVGALKTHYDELLDSNPDTRSWMSLPARMQAVRFTAPPGLKEIRILSYGKGGKKLATHTVRLPATGSAFVYGRAIETSLVAASSKELWKAP